MSWPKNILFCVSFILMSLSAPAQEHSYRKPGVLVKYRNAALTELSGLCCWDGAFWAINDGGNGSFIYRVNLSDGQVTDTFRVTNARNHDWEAMTQDPQYVYLADIGNNMGDRKDLAIYRIGKDLFRESSDHSLTAEKMPFSYPGIPAPSGKINHTDVDAEALISAGGALYIFTKKWNSGGTVVYRLYYTKDSVTAVPAGSLPVHGLVTDAVYDESSKTLYLLAYHKPWHGCNVLLYVLPGAPGEWDLKNGKRINLGLPLKQAEALAIGNDLLYIGCEAYHRIIRSKAAIYILPKEVPEHDR